MVNEKLEKSSSAIDKLLTVYNQATRRKDTFIRQKKLWNDITLPPSLVVIENVLQFFLDSHSTTFHNLKTDVKKRQITITSLRVWNVVICSYICCCDHFTQFRKLNDWNQYSKSGFINWNFQNTYMAKFLCCREINK